MAVTVSKQFAENFKLVADRWLEDGDTPEEIAELKAAIRIDLDDGEGFFRDPPHKIADPSERRKLWDDFFQAEADEIRARSSSRAAKGINDRIVNQILSQRNAA